MVKFLDLHKQYLSIRDEVDTAIQNVLFESAYVGGKYVNDFENRFAKYIGTDYCISVGNGTDALEIALRALNLPLASEVIVPANSFIASSEAVSSSNYQIRFVDNNSYYNIAISDLERNINSNTSAIMAVHLYGHPCDMDAIMSLAAKYKLRIIEDCSQSHGAKYKGKTVGTFGDVATFSFYPGKNLGAYGDGGAICTNSPGIAQQCKMIANHGSKSKYIHEIEGRNSRLDGLQAAILSVKLNHLDKWNVIRNLVANYYIDSLCGIGDLILPITEEWAYNVYHIFPLRTKYREELASYLQKNDIQTGIHYPIALPNQLAYKNIQQNCSKMNATNWDKELLSLPMGDHLTDDDCKKVVVAIKQFFKEKSIQG
ncbi:MAG TPA: DegT/DnrJ/EryC1/StrS family aminotransferase [Candidatus Kapabacteria bacterium]|nr:DegT/DnrJ/EryC1/StrS family aminotransferase [Candidatus Kapabacteria bacterium]